MNNKDENKSYNSVGCVCDVVNFINELQDCATSTCPTGCDVPFLGAHHGSKIANTRPFVLYAKNGSPFHAFVPAETGGLTISYIFRVESIDECCAVLRALEVHNPEPPEPENQISSFLVNAHSTLHPTNSCVTVDLNYFCGIQCLRDAHVPGV